MEFKDLQGWLATNQAFMGLVSQVRARHVASQFGMDRPSLEEPDWSYLMLCASILAPGSEGQTQDTALRLAHACLEDHKASGEQRAAAIAVLHSLFNQPSLSLAASRGLVSTELEESLPLSIRMDWARRRSEALHRSPVGHGILLNRLQQQLVALTSSTDWLSISAPTSAGK